MIRTIYWEDGAVVLIDQKALPLVERTITCRRYEEVIEAINDLTIRGAPAIGVAAALGIALGAQGITATAQDDFAAAFHAICEGFARTRPTARNLFWAIEGMKQCFEEAREAPETIRKRLLDRAIRICEEDVAINRRLGLNGRSLIADGAAILTHCNAGALATAGYGTALGVIRAAWEEGKKIRVFVDETRPVLQGARLTAWELMKEGIPATLITDGMAGYLMKNGRIDLVIVGADRIATNGDTANKIGTYSLAVLARHHGIPFYIAAPVSTIDPGIQSGDDIPIEERNADEVITLGGVRIAPVGIAVYNPAFDVTPHDLISALITETGVLMPPYGQAIAALFRKR
jgi:methylthioribose-1-phosphate isomerase